MESFRAFYAAYGGEMWLALAGALVLAFVWLLVMQMRSIGAARRHRALTTGVDGASLEQALHAHVERVDRLQEQVQAVAQQQGQVGEKLVAEVQRLDSQEQQTARSLGDRLDRTLHRVGVVRFNPFADAGGDQSFAVALLDEHEDGVVLSGLHSRTGTRVYAKPVARGTSTYNLSEEEREAIRKAGET